MPDIAIGPCGGKAASGGFNDPSSQTLRVGQRLNVLGDTSL